MEVAVNGEQDIKKMKKYIKSLALQYGAVLTDLVLEPDEVQPDLCIAGCRKYIESCPVHAIGDGCVEQKACRMNTYGKTARGFDTVNCNRCRTVCPMRYGKK